MSEQWLPLPAPSWDDHWEPSPARCGQCGAIIDAHPASRADGRWEGLCHKHGVVPATYRVSPHSEKDEPPQDRLYVDGEELIT